mgnify:CR=1 FL=1
MNDDERSSLNDKEMLSTFNCGIGMALIISKNELKKIQKFLKNNNEKFFVIGKVVKTIKNEERCIIAWKKLTLLYFFLVEEAIWSR